MLTDEKLMQETLHLARKGRKWVHPNPMVGALLVKNGRIICKGYHKKFGGPHAEIDLLRKVREDAKGGIVYVNLEPCCHVGKTGPCTKALIEAGVEKVVVGEIDPNPVMSGKGVHILRRAGIGVRVGILIKECRNLNKIYYKYQNTGIPFVTVKIAQTLDGKINYSKNTRTIITGEVAQKETHNLRAYHDSVLIGSRTASIDNPHLTVRLVKGKSPTRIVLDSHLKLPISLNIFNSTEAADTLISTAKLLNNKKQEKLIQRGVGIIESSVNPNGRISIKPLLKKLSKNNISSVLVEGGSQIFTSFLTAGVVDSWCWFIAPRVFSSGVNSFNIAGQVAKKVNRYRFNIVKSKSLGEDLMIEAEIRR